MEEDLIKVVVFEHYNLISKIEEVQTVEIGDPNCKLVNPYTVKTDGTLEPFLVDITRDKEIMMGSDMIITIVEPTATLIEKYKDLID